MIIVLFIVFKLSDCINYLGEGVFVIGVYFNYCYRIFQLCQNYFCGFGIGEEIEFIIYSYIFFFWNLDYLRIFQILVNIGSSNFLV